MVYRGRPSTGCMKCRQRKIKCDERPKGCVKCTDKGYICPGYDGTLNRYFLDESASVRAKAQKAKAKALAARKARDLKAKSRASIVKIQETIGVPLLCPLIDRGINFFMNHYAIGLDQPPTHSDAYHRHLSTHGFHPIIATSMTALGLAGVANLYLDPSLKREAMRWYLDAIHMTNVALASPVEVKSDNTLLATMILSVFEATSNEESLQGWSNHVEGSASLLRMRGYDQFSTPAGRRMYMQTVSLLTINCMGKGEALPGYIHAMNLEIQRHTIGNDPGIRFFHLHIQSTDLRAQILSGKLQSLDGIISRALEIDAVAMTIFEDVGDDWIYQEVHCEPDTPGVFGDCYHIYPHMAAAQTWNWMRFNRIYMHDIIRNSLVAGFSMTPPAFVGTRYLRLLEESTQTLYKMQADILASLPQFLHDTPKYPPRNPDYDAKIGIAHIPAREASRSPLSTLSTISKTTSTSSTTPNPQRFLWNNFIASAPVGPSFDSTVESTDRLPIVRTSGGYSSLWALYVAAATPIATPESQNFVLRCFERVGSELGINQGKALAKVLNYKIKLNASGKTPFEIVPSYIPSSG